MSALSETSTVVLDPDERALVADLAILKFTAGVDRGWWRLIRRDGIHVIFEVRAKTGRTIGLHADFSGYPRRRSSASARAGSAAPPRRAGGIRW